MHIPKIDQRLWPEGIFVMIFSRRSLGGCSRGCGRGRRRGLRRRRRGGGGARRGAASLGWAPFDTTGAATILRHQIWPRARLGAVQEETNQTRRCNFSIFYREFSFSPWLSANAFVLIESAIIDFVLIESAMNDFVLIVSLVERYTHFLHWAVSGERWAQI